MLSWLVLGCCQLGAVAEWKILEKWVSVDPLAPSPLNGAELGSGQHRELELLSSQMERLS
jgi:hypothetical protein